MINDVAEIDLGQRLFEVNRRQDARQPARAATSSTQSNIAISAGTSTSRTTVASTAIATAHATPISATSGIPANAKPMNTAIMISAALVMVRALVLTP